MNVETYRSPIRRSGEPPSGDQRALSDLSPAIYDLAQKLLRAHEQGGS